MTIKIPYKPYYQFLSTHLIWYKKVCQFYHKNKHLFTQNYLKSQKILDSMNVLCFKWHFVNNIMTITKKPSPFILAWFYDYKNST
ncbi:hypothetical protein CPI34_06545 [Moraxella catarrhalis]|nr:hypothetical protein [Moraxella catarrhalis]MPX34055.1 hypothetical protein [Moraxella catarrhalis]